jgi:hypothetical protein
MCRKYSVNTDGSTRVAHCIKDCAYNFQRLLAVTLAPTLAAYGHIRRKTLTIVPGCGFGQRKMPGYIDNSQQTVTRRCRWKAHISSNTKQACAQGYSSTKEQL